MSASNIFKIRATDEENLIFVSTFLQDALISVSDMTFIKNELRFALVANRFKWEDAGRERLVAGNCIYERVLCGICFDTVSGVRQNGLDQKRKAQVISLLSIKSKEGFIDLSFSAGVVVRLEVEKIQCHLQDLNEPWPTQCLPKHPLADR